LPRRVASRAQAVIHLCKRMAAWQPRLNSDRYIPIGESATRAPGGGMERG
jgi:hypothetical protein